jgi:nitrate/nitrite-specific signal transduction histidine kinase
MNNPYSKTELCTALKNQNLEFQTLLSSIQTRKFFDDSSEKWSVGHHVQHITSAVNRVAQGLANPGVLPKREPVTASRGFTTMRDAILEALQNTPSETLRQLGSRVTLEKHDNLEAYKTQLISSFANAITNFNTALESFSEEHLETLGMPHPLLGIISSREMVFFIVYHNTHHHNGIQKLLDQL